VTKVIADVTHSAHGILKAAFGGSGTIAGAPGGFFDLQFVYYDGCYINTAKTMRNYFKAYVASPPSRSPILASYEYLKSAIFSETKK